MAHAYLLRSEFTLFSHVLSSVGVLMGHVPSQPEVPRPALRERRFPSSVYGTLRYGSVEEVGQLLEEDPAGMAEYEGASGLTPVILAAKLGRVDVLEKLLRCGMPVGSHSAITTPLLEALGRARCDCVDLLLRSSPTLVTVASLSGVTPLMSAVAGGCMHCIEEVLIRLGPVHPSASAGVLSEGRTSVSPMQIAVATSRKDVVQRLLDSGIGPDEGSVEECVRLQNDNILYLLLESLPEGPNAVLDAALVEACRGCSNAGLVARLLSEHGARVSPKALQAATDPGIVAILMSNCQALRFSDSEWIGILGAHVSHSRVLETLWSSTWIPQRARLKALEIAVAQDAPSAIVRVMEKTSNGVLLPRDDLEEALLVRSAQCGSTRCLYYLLRDYATISISLPKIRLKVVPNTYVDALERASVNAHHTVLDMLLNNGCMVTETALVAATLGGSELCLQRLLFSADIKGLKESLGWWYDSLLIAAYTGHVGCARVLLSLWPDKAAERIRLSDGGGVRATPLSVAALRGHVGMVHLLGEYCNTKQMVNALEVAAFMGYPRVCEEVLKALPQPLPGWALPRKTKHEGISLWLQDCTKAEIIS
ncbi:ankyrin repeat domain containing protein [Perkinsus marinus ATCC 50983]|uniref:Ankyrin repeat domain containing protein n=1 Tax=Perkinsus marinus (strain ATCC 50983 / TXsc) TaxID=423536 RepID=C5KDA0_PERM5|nr:ankyrin repeat domain containing protein [Perkinsus marinus ATCC 50983]EER17533.1 ankyrin repeat domain containing protein [Perkinsus marinus ATCC 50983]|eukprot:XP_002785737.1 ankyrin repeat domain containing protein [Perkinsus marinus ATCC 50983]